LQTFAIFVGWKLLSISCSCSTTPISKT
jgi:hypothetical protein